MNRKDPFTTSGRVVRLNNRRGSTTVVAICRDEDTALDLCALLNSGYWLGKS